LFVNDEQKLASLPESEFTISFADTDANGHYEIEIPEGPILISFGSRGDVVEADFENGKPLPDLVLKSLPVISGKVLDPNGRPVVGAIIRVIKYMGETEYTQTDKDGRFEIEVDDFEYDIESNKLIESDSVKVLAFDPHGPLACIVDVDISTQSKHSNITVELAEREPHWIAKEISELHKGRPERLMAKMGIDYEKEKLWWKEKYPDVEYGMPAPSFTGGTWFNSNARSLEDFRGQYVLLDFWFVGCGPCIRDFPNLKLANKLFGKHGFTVVSVHTSASRSAEDVKKFCDASGLDFPLVVDGPGEEILKSYKPLGVESFPSYLLIDPQGKIIKGLPVSNPESNGQTLSLRGDKLEVLRQQFLLKDAETP